MSRKLDALQTVTFQVPLPPNGLGPNGRLHWRKKAALKASYMTDVMILSGQQVSAYQREGKGFMQRAHVFYDWHSTHQVDADNAIGRMKPVLDYLQGRVLANDRDVTLSYQWHKAATKKAERVVVTVIREHVEQENTPHDHGGLRHQHFHRPGDGHDHMTGKGVA